VFTSYKRGTIQALKSARDTRFQHNLQTPACVVLKRMSLPIWRRTSHKSQGRNCVKSRTLSS